MTFLRLLAKSSNNPDTPEPPELLHGHTALVFDAAIRLLAHCGEASLAAVGLPTTLRGRLDLIVRIAAFLHDLGKCSTHFQLMLRQPGTKQLLRHEALSGWLAWEGPLEAWLTSDAAVDDLRLAIAAAVGHHRKFRPEDYAKGAGPLTLLVAHEDFAAVLAFGARRLSLPPAPRFDRDITITDPEVLLRSFDRWHDDLCDLSDDDCRLLGVAKAILISADVAGSALPRADTSNRWIDVQLERHDAQAAGKIAAARLGAKLPRPFQNAVAEAAGPVTLVRAGCGTGKTLAAYLWASRQHSNRRLWFTYPTTGTTTEGYRDYLHDVHIDALLEHSRARVDYRIFGLDDEGGTTRDLDRLEALRSWGADVTTSTVDTVLGLLQNQRKGLYAWPVLCRSAFVFDEIHAYDDRLFGGLLEFLEQLPGLPVLLMTASLPAHRLHALQSLVESVHNRELAVVTGAAELEGLPRYRIARTDDADRRVQEVLDRGGKVLWVCNTVDDAIAVARRLAAFHPLLYHSRFRYVDRVHRHAEVIAAFSRPGSVLAVTTQVAEMSLDLSADLLVTRLAPVPALIQRLGRLNRRATPEAPRDPAPCLVLPFTGLPYEDRDLKEATQWLASLGDAPLSQRSLVECWTPPDDDVAQTRSCWIWGGIDTFPGQTRDSSPGITVLLAEDAERIRTRRADIMEVALPMTLPPKKFRMTAWPRERGIPIAPADVIEYDQREGGRWRT